MARCGWIVSESGWIVVLTGRPATGKSALAALLHARFGWPVLAKDVVKEALFDTLGGGDRTWSRRLSNASFELLFRLVPRTLSAVPVGVLEGNFREPEHFARVRALACSMSARLLIVELRAADDIIGRRLRLRAADPARHPGHRDRELAVALAGEVPASATAGPPGGETDATGSAPSAEARLVLVTDDLCDVRLEQMAASIRELTTHAPC